MEDYGFFPLSPVFENCDVDISLIKKYGIDHQYEKSRFCWLFWIYL